MESKEKTNLRLCEGRFVYADQIENIDLIDRSSTLAGSIRYITVFDNRQAIDKLQKELNKSNG